MDTILLVSAMAPVVLAVILVVPALYARGQTLRCPNCGEVFRAPALDQRMYGVGWSPPYMGRVTCPKCKEARSRRDYQKVRPTSGEPGGAQKA